MVAPINDQRIESLPANVVDNPASGINSVRGSNAVRAAWRSGQNNSSATVYNAEARKAELRQAFTQGRTAVKNLLMRWGWTAQAFEQLFPSSQSNNFNWDTFLERIESIVMAYDEMDSTQKAAYCRIRNIDNVNRGWATFAEYAPRVYETQAVNTINELAGTIAEIGRSDTPPSDSAGAMIWQVLQDAKATNNPAVRFGSAAEVRGWPRWLMDAVYLRLATEAGPTYLAVRPNGLREVKHEELRNYLLQARRRENQVAQTPHNNHGSNRRTERRTERRDADTVNFL